MQDLTAFLPASSIQHLESCIPKSIQPASAESYGGQESGIQNPRSWNLKPDTCHLSSAFCPPTSDIWYLLSFYCILKCLNV